MRKQLHPVSRCTTFSCGNCGTAFNIPSTAAAPEVLDTCSNCHPVYTRKVKARASGTRIEAFNNRYKSQN